MGSVRLATFVGIALGAIAVARADMGVNLGPSYRPRTTPTVQPGVLRGPANPEAKPVGHPIGSGGMLRHDTVELSFRGMPAPTAPPPVKFGGAPLSPLLREAHEVTEELAHSMGHHLAAKVSETMAAPPTFGNNNNNLNQASNQQSNDGTPPLVPGGLPADQLTPQAYAFQMKLKRVDDAMASPQMDAVLAAAQGPQTPASARELTDRLLNTLHAQGSQHGLTGSPERNERIRTQLADAIQNHGDLVQVLAIQLLESRGETGAAFTARTPATPAENNPFFGACGGKASPIAQRSSPFHR
jgi:hypothetical protein